jgi:hypothetical protein
LTNANAEGVFDRSFRFPSCREQVSDTALCVQKRMTNARGSLEEAAEVQQELERLQVRGDFLGFGGVGEFIGGHVGGV